MKLSIFVPLTVFLSFTAAELATSNEETSNEEVRPCLNECLTEGVVVSGCTSQYNSECTCPSAAFRDALETCLEAACTAEDKQAAKGLHQERCGTGSG